MEGGGAGRCGLGRRIFFWAKMMERFTLIIVFQEETTLTC